MITEDLIKPAKYHRSIDGIDMARARERAGLSQQQLAEAVAVILDRDLSQQYIQQIEAPGEHEIPVAIAKAIQEAL